MQVIEGLAVPMRDSIVLRADAYLPDGEGPWPVVLSRTPYRRSLGLIQTAALDPERAVVAGLAVVGQDVRGRFGSEGEFTTFLPEGPDTHDTVEWIAGQPWCSGPVGMAGRSYAGANQWLGAIEQPPHLAAIFPAVCGSTFYDGWIYQGGAFQLGFNLFWTRMMADPKAKSRIEPLYEHLPLPEVPGLCDNPEAAYYFEWLAHPSDDDYWRSLAINRNYGRIQVPAWTVAGWYDLFLAGSIENFTGMRREGATEQARAGQHLLIGPWGHGSTYGPYPDHGFEPFGGTDAVDLADLQLRFFARYLQGDVTAMDGVAPVRIFVMGANTWRDETDWPLARATPMRWFLRAGGRLAPEAPGDGEAPDVYRYDPAAPAPTVGGPTAIPGPMMRMNMGPRDQAALEQRPDVLVFTSEPLPRPLEVTGPLLVELYAATTAVDTDFVVKLTHVRPDGTSTILAEGVRRARYRNGYEQPEPMEPGRPARIPVDLVATSNLFGAGDRIRVDVTSSSFPRFDRNPNSGKPFGTDGPEDLRAAQQTVFHDAARPSHVLLPIVSG